MDSVFYKKCKKCIKSRFRTKSDHWPFDRFQTMEAEIITKAATFNSFLQLSCKNTQIRFLWQCFLIFSWQKH